MKQILHKAETRGRANHGWLQSFHTFSFAGYHNPHRMNFGVLRVLNDDTVAGGQGFGTHPHANMEIISIPLTGDLEHKDSMGNTTVIKSGDVQVMSAGTGVQHSEYNKNETQEVKFLQIWVIPNSQNTPPRYDQISMEDVRTENSFYQILSPHAEDQGVWIHQNAWFHLGDFSKETALDYTLKDSNNGVYAFILEGSGNVGNEQVSRRDGTGIWEVEKISLDMSKGSRVLLMEIPLTI
ncbi:MAG: pirin family protein [Flavobacteriales bacterium]